MRRFVIALIICGLALGSTSPAWARWVWRDGHWLYVEEALPPAPEAPKATPPASKPAPGAPKTAPQAPKVVPIAPSPAPKEEEPIPPPAPSITPAAPVVPATPVAPSAAPPLFVPETRVEAPAKKESPAPATPAAAPPSSEAEKPAAGGVDWKAAWLKMKRGPVDDKILLDMGMSHLKAKDYKNAASMLDDLIQHFPTSQYREEAMWLRGVALWAMEEHYLVYEQYEEFIITYAGSPHYLDALMKEMEVAEKFLTGTHRKIWGVALLVSAESEGLEILRKVYEHQPTGDLAPKIVARIADYHWGQRAWNDAEDYYDKYCREFPNGPDVRRAELLRAKCAIERCRGSRYDTTCLQLAYDRLKQFQQKYPQEAEQENVAHLLEQVRDTQAMGLYEAAAHYMRTNRPEAAAHYVETLEARFPDTPWAEQARRLLPGPSLKQEHEP